MSINSKELRRVGVWWGRRLSRRRQFILDITILVLAFAIAYWLRFDFDVPDDWVGNEMFQLPLVVLIQFIMLTLTGGRSFIWRYTGIGHVRPFFYAALASFVIIFAFKLGLPDTYFHWRVPASVCIIDTGLAFGGLLALRVVRRYLYERFE